MYELRLQMKVKDDPVEALIIPLKPGFFFQASSFQLLKLENLLR